MHISPKVFIGALPVDDNFYILLMNFLDKIIVRQV